MINVHRGGKKEWTQEGRSERRKDVRKAEGMEEKTKGRHEERHDGKTEGRHRERQEGRMNEKRT